MNEKSLTVLHEKIESDDELRTTVDQEQQYLSFSLGDELYAVDILSVQEIRTWETTTLLPRSPDYMKGVLNLRGAIVPVIDLRLKFTICQPIYDDTTAVIILRLEENNQIRVMGIVVDAMSDVLFIDKEKIHPSPEFGSHVDSDYIDGLTTVNGEVVSLLNSAALLNIDNINHETETREN